MMSSDDTDELVLRMLRPYSLTASGQTWFEALVKLRQQLESKGCLLLCYGASINSHPSPMSLGMGEGRLVYQLHAGQQARSSDLRDIFSAEPGLPPATIEEQRAFYRDWLVSLKVNP